MNRTLALLLAPFVLVMCVALSSCSDDEESSRSSDAQPEIMTTSAGVEFVRTPDACFENLPDWPYEPQYVEIDELRQAYVDEIQSLIHFNKLDRTRATMLDNPAAKEPENATL